MLLEKRLAARRTANIEATLIFGTRKVTAIVRNVSDGGAKLEVASVRAIPDFFELHVPGHRPQRCRVVWRSLKELGIAFVPQAIV